MFRVFVALVMATGLLILSVSDAEARRRIRIPLGGSSQGVELLYNLPNIPELKHRSGAYIDFGRLTGSRSGELVGYIGSSSKYVKLSKQDIERIFSLAGINGYSDLMDRLEKSQPKRKRSSSGGMGFGTILMLGAFLYFGRGFLFRLFGSLIGSAAGAATRRIEKDQEENPAAWANADDAIARAVAEKQSRYGGADRFASSGAGAGAGAAVARTSVEPDGGRAAFGLRQR